MSWQTITLTVPDELKDAVVGEFSNDGIAGVWERDADGAGCELVLYFGPVSRARLVDARIGRLFQRNGYPAPEVRVGTQRKEDWSEEWRRGFTSFPLGRRFRVVPSWEEPAAGDDRIPLRIDPGLAFGTGTHETTRLVIEEMEALDARGAVAGPVVDLGTGTAILSIAAVRLGWRGVVACDVDRDAAAVARSNLRRNRADVPVYVGSADALADAVVEVMMANLTAEAIRGLLPEMHRIVRPGGSVLLSGILGAQADAVRGDVVVAGFAVRRERAMGEWVVMAAERRSTPGNST